MIGLILPAQPGAPSINGSQLLAHLHFYSVPNPTKPSLVLPLLAISLPTIIISISFYFQLALPGALSRAADKSNSVGPGKNDSLVARQS